MKYNNVNNHISCPSMMHWLHYLSHCLCSHHPCPSHQCPSPRDCLKALKSAASQDTILALSFLLSIWWYLRSQTNKNTDDWQQWGDHLILRYTMSRAQKLTPEIRPGLETLASLTKIILLINKDMWRHVSQNHHKSGIQINASVQDQFWNPKKN